MNGNKIEIIQAYTELYCLLQYFPMAYLQKLPPKLLDILQQNSNETYRINIDVNKDIQSQNLSKKAKDILAVLTYHYWSNEDQKSYLKKCFGENEAIFQKELVEKYSTDALFQNKKSEKKQEGTDLVSVPPKKGNWFSRFATRLKQFFHK